MKKLIALLFSLYIFLLPWQSVYLLREIFIDGEKWQYGTIGIYSTTLVAIALIAMILLGRTLHKISLPKIDRPTLFIGALFIGLSYLSFFWAQEKTIVLYSTTLFFIGFLLYLLVPRNTNSFRTATILLLLSASLHSIIALIQFLTQSIDTQVILSISKHFTESGATATITDTTGRWLRAYGGMVHPNILGGFLALSILLGMHAYVQTQKSHVLVRTTLLIGLSLSFIGLVITFSRSAWIALIIGLLTATLFLWHKKQSLFRKIQMPLLAFMSIGLLFFLLLPQLFFTRTIENTLQSHNSFSERADSITQAKELTQSMPLIGIGRGNITIINYENSADPLKKIWQYQPVHNVFLLIFTELGAIGFLLFIALVSIVIHTSLQASKNHPTTHAFFASICVALLTISFFDHWLITSHFGILFFWLLMTLYKNIHTVQTHKIQSY